MRNEAESLSLQHKKKKKRNCEKPLLWFNIFTHVQESVLPDDEGWEVGTLLHVQSWCGTKAYSGQHGVKPKKWNRNWDKMPNC